MSLAVKYRRTEPFRGVLLTRQVFSDMFAACTTAISSVEGADFTAWTDVDIMQGKLRERDPDRRQAKKQVFEAALPLLQAPEIGALTISKLAITNRSKLIATLQGPGRLDLQREKRRITDVTNTTLDTDIYTSLGSFTVYDQSAFIEGYQTVKRILDPFKGSDVSVGPLSIYTK